MARNVMLADDVYDRLKKLKEAGGQSFSEVIRDMLNERETKTIGDVFEHYGTFEGDEEYDRVMESLREEWERWSERYA